MTENTQVRVFECSTAVPLGQTSRSYRHILLPNGVLTLLISDPTEDLAACSLTVATGSHADPDSVPGLAHLCEHLLPLASKQFPKPGLLHQTLSRHGGRYNASTSGEQTSYYFEIPTNSLVTGQDSAKDIFGEPIFSHVLRMFSSFFRSPQFPEDLVQREIHVINDEHNENKTNEAKLMFHGLRLLAAEGHPFHRFCTGNIFTLAKTAHTSDISMRNEVKMFFSKEYTSSKMSLVLRGPQSLNMLQKMALQFFSFSASERAHTLENSPRPYTDTSLEAIPTLLKCWKYKTDIFSGVRAKVILIDSPSAPTSLRFNFAIKHDPDSKLRRQYDLFCDAWCQMLGNEGIGGLTDGYKELGLASTIISSRLNPTNDMTFLTLSVRLTQKGAESIEKVISMFFEYLEVVLSSPDGDLGSNLSDLCSIDLLRFLYRDNELSPMEEAVRLSKLLQTNLVSLSPTWLVKGSSSWSDLDHEYSGGFSEDNANIWWIKRAREFKVFLRKFCSQNSLALVIYGSGISFDNLKKVIQTTSSKTQDKAFGFDYQTGVFIPGSIICLSRTFPTFFINPVNKFMPSIAYKHSVILQALRSTAERSRNANLSFFVKTSARSEIPKVIGRGHQYTLWLQREINPNYASRSLLSAEIVCHSLRPSPMHTICMDVLCELLKLRLDKHLYDLELLGSTYNFIPSIKGDVRLGLHISGFSENAEAFLLLVKKRIKLLAEDFQYQVDSNLFRDSRIRVRTKYNFLETAPSVAVASAGLLLLLEQYTWSIEERLEALEDMTRHDMEQFLRRFFLEGQNEVTMFLHGDSDELSLKKLFSVVADFALPSYYHQLRPLPDPSTYVIPQGVSYSCSRPSSEQDPTSSIVYFLQTGRRHDVAAFTLTKFTAFMMAIDLVPSLRNSKVAYLVLGGLRILRGSIGIHITTVSSHLTAEQLERKIDEHLHQWETTLGNMSEATFHSNFVVPFLEGLENKSHRLESSGGPASVTLNAYGSKEKNSFADRGTTASIKKHRSSWEQITSKDYSFDASYESKIDIEVVRELTLSRLMEFFRRYVSIESRARSKLSIMVQSRKEKLKVESELLIVHLSKFLKMKGLYITSEQLHEIVEGANGSQGVMFKDLFKFFVDQGKSLRLCTVILKEGTKLVSDSFKLSKPSSAVIKAPNAALENICVTDIQAFQTSLSLVPLK